MEIIDPQSEHTEQKLPAGTLIANRYRIIKTLGTGGMGSVYLAADTVLGDEKIAVKILHANFVHDETQLARFLREVQLMRKVNHRNVVRTFDVGTEGEHTYFTMEYVPGVQLETLITDANITREQLVHYLIQICEALRVIHAAGIIHRDLKPANILVLKDGTIRVTDFGVARPEVSNLTGHDEIVGSVCYIAPEIWLGKKITHSADLYALGVIIYEMLTQTVPFDGNSPAVLMRAHLDRTPRPPKDLAPSTPVWLNKLTLKLLAKSPSDRPRDAKEVIDYLKLNAGEGKGDKNSRQESAQPFFDELESHTKVITGESVFARRGDTVSGGRKNFFKRLFPRRASGTGAFAARAGSLTEFISRLGIGILCIALIFLVLGSLQFAAATLFPQIGSQISSETLLEKPDYYANLRLFETLTLLLPQILLHLLQLSTPILLLGAAIGAPNYAIRFVLRGYVVLLTAFLALAAYFLAAANETNSLSIFSAATTARDQIAAIALLSPATTVYEQIGLGAGLVQNATGMTPLFRSPAAFGCFLFFASFLAYTVQHTLRNTFGTTNRLPWIVLIGLVIAIFVEGIFTEGTALSPWREYFQLSLRLPAEMLAFGAFNWFLVFLLSFIAAVRSGSRRRTTRAARRR